MTSQPIVLDLETKYTFRDYSDPKDLQISVVGVYNYQTHQLATYFEKDLNQLFPILEKASIIIGYNIDHFDLPVLSRYYPGSIDQLPRFDILADIKNIIGKRMALNDVVGATIGKKKSGHGLIAIELFRQKKFEELAKYCLDDVSLTRELFEYGVKKGEINYLTEYGKQTIKVDWKKYKNWTNNKDVSLTLPF